MFARRPNIPAFSAAVKVNQEGQHDDAKRQISVIQSYDTLSESQKTQFRQVITQGLRGKFAGALGDDTDAMLSVVDIWIRYGFLPIRNAYLRGLRKQPERSCHPAAQTIFTSRTRWNRSAA
jgi:hypothetical protein